MKTKSFVVTVLLLLLLTFGCVEDSEYKKITAEQAKNIMDTEQDVVILDVRTESEYNSGHIPQAILLPDYEIKDRAEQVIPDKDKKILVYCRSGNRSKNAAKELISIGYKNVYDFGGINDWKYQLVS